MPGNIRLIKGKVVIEDRFTSLEEGIVRARHRGKRAFEFWRTHHRSLSFLVELSDLEELSLINATVNARFRTKKHNDVFSEHLMKFRKRQYRDL